MKRSIFLLLVVGWGAVDGLAQGVVTLFLVESYLDFAIEIENQCMFMSGIAQDSAEFRVSHEKTCIMQKSSRMHRSTCPTLNDIVQ